MSPFLYPFPQDCVHVILGWVCTNTTSLLCLRATDRFFRRLIPPPKRGYLFDPLSQFTKVWAHTPSICVLEADPMDWPDLTQVGKWQLIRNLLQAAWDGHLPMVKAYASFFHQWGAEGGEPLERYRALCFIAALHGDSELWDFLRVEDRGSSQPLHRQCIYLAIGQGHLDFVQDSLHTSIEQIVRYLILFHEFKARHGRQFSPRCRDPLCTLAEHGRFDLLQILHKTLRTMQGVDKRSYFSRHDLVCLATGRGDLMREVVPGTLRAVNYLLKHATRVTAFEYLHIDSVYGPMQLNQINRATRPVEVTHEIINWLWDKKYIDEKLLQLYTSSYSNTPTNHVWSWIHKKMPTLDPIPDWYQPYHARRQAVAAAHSSHQ
jgi:hypothetical protein